jgi:hypothetical protein
VDQSSTRSVLPAFAALDPTSAVVEMTSVVLPTGARASGENATKNLRLRRWREHHFDRKRSDNNLQIEHMA